MSVQEINSFMIPIRDFDQKKNTDKRWKIGNYTLGYSSPCTPSHFSIYCVKRHALYRESTHESLWRCPHDNLLVWYMFHFYNWHSWLCSFHNLTLNWVVKHYSPIKFTKYQSILWRASRHCQIWKDSKFLTQMSIQPKNKDQLQF